jgi:ABC-type transport system substrate-binding protein
LWIKKRRIGSLPRVRAPLALLTAAVCLLACEPTNSTPAPSPARLAEDQTLSFPIAQDVADFDPALISSPGEVDILRNVFSGLYRFDDKLREVPDLAEGPPTVSTDGREYTFRIKPAARFSNGDPVTAADIRYSWNRAAAAQGDYAGLFSIVKSSTAVDSQTLKVTLLRPASYFLTLVALAPFWSVDQHVFESSGALIGSGPFRMTARTPGQSMDFEPVRDWYGGSTGALTHVHVQVVADTAVQLSQFEAGIFSLIGYGRQSLSTGARSRDLLGWLQPEDRSVRRRRRRTCGTACFQRGDRPQGSRGCCLQRENKLHRRDRRSGEQRTCRLPRRRRRHER